MSTITGLRIETHRLRSAEYPFVHQKSRSVKGKLLSRSDAVWHEAVETLSCRDISELAVASNLLLNALDGF